jgi:hypothetical protein
MKGESICSPPMTEHRKGYTALVAFLAAACSRGDDFAPFSAMSVLALIPADSAFVLVNRIAAARKADSTPKTARTVDITNCNETAPPFDSATHH